MKYGFLFLLILTLTACHKEPETVDVKRVFMCAFNNHAEVCSTLNSTERKALSCLKNSGEFSKKECDEIKMNSGPAKSPGIQFHLRPGTGDR